MSAVFEQLVELGPIGLVIGVLLVAIITLVKALQVAHSRERAAVDKMVEMAKEANLMIERISGRP